MIDKRPYDVVIHGASGFTGRLVAEYMAAHDGLGLRYALSGRNLDKLEAVRGEIGAPDSLPLLSANANDLDSLRELAASSYCVCAVVGPYQLYGSDLLAACAEQGTAYVDLSGEPLWMGEMIAQHQQKAVASGARIVHSCGFDSIPFDLGVLHLQQTARREFGEPCQSVHARVLSMKGAYSGGTAASLNATEERVARLPELAARLCDPFLLADGFRGPEQPAGDAVYEDVLTGQWVTPFVMAIINSKNIHRSNALMGHAYGEDFQYEEMMATGLGEQGHAIAEAMTSINPLRGEHAPVPGEGPSKEIRENGHFNVLLVGKTQGGREIRTAVTGQGDPGYGCTSRMIAESAACLVQDFPDLAGGFYTPAPAMGERLIERLQARAKMCFAVESID